MRISLKIDEAAEFLTEYFATKLNRDISTIHIDISGNLLKIRCFENAVRIIKNGNKIAAIKYIRTVGKLGLAESKAIADRLENGEDYESIIFQVVNEHEI